MLETVESSLKSSNGIVCGVALAANVVCVDVVHNVSLDTLSTFELIDSSV